jgi:uncharacterized protein
MLSQMTDEEIGLLAFDATQREDFETAIGLLTPLAKKDSIFALETLGWIHANGHRGQLNSKLARQYFGRAIAAGSVQAHLHFGWMLMKERRFEEARVMLVKGSENGGDDFKNALTELARLEAENLKSEENLARDAFNRKDYQQAFDILDRYKTSNSQSFLMGLGWLYQMGLGCAEDKSIAISLYRRAAQIGSIESHYYIGMLELEKGDSEAARVAFSEGAVKEHWPSMSMLGEMMIEGDGGPIEIADGLRILTSCAQQGHMMSKVRLLRREIKMTESKFKRIILRLQVFRMIGHLVVEIPKDPFSQKFFELVP